MSRQLAEERRSLANAIHAHAREMWAMGRNDRVAGLAPSIKHGQDFYYRTAYNGERRKEVPVGKDSSGNC